MTLNSGIAKNRQRWLHFSVNNGYKLDPHNYLSIWFMGRHLKITYEFNNWRQDVGTFLWSYWAFSTKLGDNIFGMGIAHNGVNRGLFMDDKGWRYSKMSKASD